MNVGRVLAKAGASVRIAGQGDRGFDIAFEREDRHVLVEVKSWSRAAPYRLVGHALERLSAAVEREGAHEGILVLPNSAQQAAMPSGVTNVRVMTVRQFRNYVVHLPHG